MSVTADRVSQPEIMRYTLQSGGCALQPDKQHGRKSPAKAVNDRTEKTRFLARFHASHATAVTGFLVHKNRFSVDSLISLD